MCFGGVMCAPRLFTLIDKNMLVLRQHLDEMDPRYCANGARRWFARMGLDWAAFVRDGIDAEVLLATGDAMALKIVEHVRRRYGQG